MHDNYFYLRQLTSRLKSEIYHYTVDACYSQNRDELILVFCKDPKRFYIQADLKAQFSCLSFPNPHVRARKNSIDLFPEITGHKVLNINTFLHERAFSIDLDEGYRLLFILFGKRSNILLFKDDICTDVFKHGTGDENKIDPRNLGRECPPFMPEEDISKKILLQSFPSFDQHVLNHLEDQGLFQVKDPAFRMELINNTLAMLNNPSFYIYEKEDMIRFSLMPVKDAIREESDPIDAINFFYSEYVRRDRLRNEKKRLLRDLNRTLKKSQNYIRNSERKLNELETRENYRHVADVIMANLNNIQAGRDEAELLDFYHNRKIRIKLKPGLSPQKNAEHYYRKARNQVIEIKNLEQNLATKEKLAEKTQMLIHIMQGMDNLRELIHFARKNNLITIKKDKKTESLLFKSYTCMGFQILVGGNARKNDELTFRYGYKEDLWLHAKDVKGSHVLVKYQAGKNFPKPVIEMAAQLAAYNSANRNTDTCPVIYTPRKYVRKSKGMPPGMVLVDREQIVFVKPENHPDNPGV